MCYTAVSVQCIWYQSEFRVSVSSIGISMNLVYQYHYGSSIGYQYQGISGTIGKVESGQVQLRQVESGQDESGQVKAGNFVGPKFLGPKIFDSGFFSPKVFGPKFFCSNICYIWCLAKLLTHFFLISRPPRGLEISSWTFLKRYPSLYSLVKF